MIKKLGLKDFWITTTKMVAYTGASNFNTDALDLKDFSKPWVFYAESTHTVGTPSITIQISSDGTNWLDYVSDATNINLPVSISESKFYPNYMRIAYTANSSNGNVTFKLQQLDT